jgi:hypothetical protein
MPAKTPAPDDCRSGFQKPALFLRRKYTAVTGETERPNFVLKAKKHGFGRGSPQMARHHPYAFQIHGLKRARAGTCLRKTKWRKQ